MTLSQRLAEYVRACFTGIWIQSHEHDDALAEIARLCRAENWRLATWDIDRGLSVAGQEADTAGADPLSAIRAVSALADPKGTALLVLDNFHRFLNSAEVVQALVRQIVSGKQNRTFLLVLSPVVQIPVELEKLFVVLEHELPDKDQLEAIARGTATEPDDLPEDAALDQVIDAASGLTRYEAEGAFSLSIARHGRLSADVIWELKAQTLKKSGLLQLYRGGERFSDRAGWNRSKTFAGGLSGGVGGEFDRPAAWNPAAQPPGLRQERPGQGTGQRGGTAHDYSRRGRPVGLLGRPIRAEHPPGTQDRRCHGALRAHGGRARQGIERRGVERPNRFGRQRPAVWNAAHLAQRPRNGRVFHRDV